MPVFFNDPRPLYPSSHRQVVLVLGLDSQRAEINGKKSPELVQVGPLLHMLQAHFIFQSNPWKGRAILIYSPSVVAFLLHVGERFRAVGRVVLINCNSINHIECPGYIFFFLYQKKLSIFQYDILSFFILKKSIFRYKINMFFPH